MTLTDLPEIEVEIIANPVFAVASQTMVSFFERCRIQGLDPMDEASTALFPICLLDPEYSASKARQMAVVVERALDDRMREDADIIGQTVASTVACLYVTIEGGEARLLGTNDEDHPTFIGTHQRKLVENHCESMLTEGHLS